MTEPLAPLSAEPPNPFTPDFGTDPHCLVGRDDLVASLREGLSAGPRDWRFHSLLLGPRGTGKTVVLGHIKEAARLAGWIVLPLDASTDGVEDRLDALIDWARESSDLDPDPSGRTERSAVSVKLWPFEWQREAAREVRPKWDLRRRLTVLADHAGRHGAAVLLILDEMQSGERRELRRLSADLQLITKGEKVPLAFLGAGLSEMKHTMLEDKKMSFFARCHRADMPPLLRTDASRFLRTAVQDAGGRIDAGALPLLVDACGTLPYKMQLVGHCAWTAAGAPRAPIDEQSAVVAIQEAHALMHERVSLPVWESLRPDEKDYLRRLASLGGEARPHDIASDDVAGSRNLGRTLRHLTNVGCVVQRNSQVVMLTDLVPERSMDAIVAEERIHLATDGATVRSLTLQRCNEWMPRAQARCILASGHGGGHRSR